MNTDGPGVDALTERIIGCAFTVSNTLGCAFLEKVYETALAHELRKAVWLSFSNMAWLSATMGSLSASTSSIFWWKTLS